MIADLKPYPATKDSGIEWLGDVPAGWYVRRLKTVFREIDLRSGTGEEPLLSLRMRAGLVDHHEAGGKPIPPSALAHYKRTEPGEIVMNRMRAAAGLFAVTPKIGLVSPDYAVLRPRREICLDYFVHLFRTPQAMSIFRLESRGLGTGESGFLRLYTERFGMLHSPVPPPQEQAAIVRYLDHVDRRVRRLVRAKRKLIALLTEQKQAIIHQTFAGTRTSVWRSFPAWAVLRPAKRVGHPDKTLLSLFRDFGVIPKASRENKNVDVRDLALCQFVEVGDVVMNKMKAWQGSIAVSDVEGIVSPDYMVLRVIKEGISPKFLHYLLRSPAMITEYRRQAYGVRPGQWRLMHDEFRQLHIHLPPVEEQEAIARSIDEAHARISVADDALSCELATLSEYRTRLIADVVTGKLDVREAAARLPEVDPLDAEDDLEDLDADGEVDPDDLDVIPEEAEG